MDEIDLTQLGKTEVSRRSVLRKAAYTAPAVFAIAAAPKVALGSSGSHGSRPKKRVWGRDKKHGGRNNRGKSGSDKKHGGRNNRGKSGRNKRGRR